MNSLFVLLDIESWKPVLTALMLPPVPLLVLLLFGARLLLSSRLLGWLTILFSVSALWLSATTGTGRWLNNVILRPPISIGTERIAELKALARSRQPVTIVVLGAGTQPFAPEYRMSNLTDRSLERLQYGIWLGRETGLPVGFSGGVGWQQKDSVPEAQVAARVAAQDFGRPLQWIEDKSRDTHENGANTVAQLKAGGTKHIVLVTHGWHMPRAMRAFERSAGADMRVEAAPMGLGVDSQTRLLSWLPSAAGYELVRSVLREMAGSALGA